MDIEEYLQYFRQQQQQQQGAEQQRQLKRATTLAAADGRRRNRPWDKEHHQKMKINLNRSLIFYYISFSLYPIKDGFHLSFAKLHTIHQYSHTLKSHSQQFIQPQIFKIPARNNRIKLFYLNFAPNLPKLFHPRSRACTSFTRHLPAFAQQRRPSGGCWCSFRIPFSVSVTFHIIPNRFLSRGKYGHQVFRVDLECWISRPHLANRRQRPPNHCCYPRLVWGVFQSVCETHRTHCADIFQKSFRGRLCLKLKDAIFRVCGPGFSVNTHGMRVPL